MKFLIFHTIKYLIRATTGHRLIEFVYAPSPESQINSIAKENEIRIYEWHLLPFSRISKFY